MWTFIITLLNKIPSWIFLIIIGILLLTSGGLYLLHTIDAKELSARAVIISEQKVTIATLEAEVKLKAEKIENLQLTMNTANKNIQDFQARNTKLIGIINSLGKPVVIQSTGKNELNAINKADSDKFIKWMNEEIWK